MADGTYLMAGYSNGHLFKYDGANWSDTPAESATGNNFINWRCSYISTDGSKMIAAGIGSYVYIYSNGSWSYHDPEGLNNPKTWSSVAIALGVDKYIACESTYVDEEPGYYAGRIWIYSGSTWTEERPTGLDESKNWNSVGISGDGTKYIASSLDGLYYYDGNSWSQITPTGYVNGQYFNAKISNDGTKFLVYVNQETNGGVFTYDGNVWTKHNPGNIKADFSGADMSGEGNKFVIASNKYADSKIWTYDGATWTAHSDSILPTGSYFTKVSCSYDATKIIAGYRNSGKVLYYDGDTWSETKPNGDVTRDWYTVAISKEAPEINNFTKSFTTKANILVMGEWSEDWQYEVVLTVSKTIQAKSNIVGLKTRTISSRSRIGTVLSNTISSKANILNTITKTVFAKAIIGTLYGKTISAKSSIKTGFEKTVSAKGDIKTIGSYSDTTICEWTLLNEEWNSIGSWSDSDNTYGVSSINPSGELRLDCTSSSGSSIAGRQGNTNDFINDNFTASIRFKGVQWGGYSGGLTHGIRLRINAGHRALIIFISNDSSLGSGILNYDNNLVLSNVYSYTWDNNYHTVTVHTKNNQAQFDIYVDGSLVAENINTTGYVSPNGEILLLGYGTTTKKGEYQIDYLKINDGLCDPYNTSKNANHITSKSKIIINHVETIYSKSNIKKNASSTISANAKIENELIRTITANAIILKQQEQTIYVTSNIKSSITKNISSVCNILKSKTRNISAHASLINLTIKTINAKSRINKILSVTIIAKAHIQTIRVIEIIDKIRVEDRIKEITYIKNITKEIVYNKVMIVSVVSPKTKYTKWITAKAVIKK